MSRGRPATAAERSAMSRRLVTAADLADRHVGRQVKVGEVSGTLVGLVPVRERVNLVVIVGGARAIFPLDKAAVVEVWREAT